MEIITWYVNYIYWKYKDIEKYSIVKQSMITCLEGLE